MATIVETNFFGNFEQAEDPRVMVIPIPYEYTSSYIKGSKNGPQAILNGSKRLEKFDDELWLDTSSIGINTSHFVIPEFVHDKSKQPFFEVEQAVRNAVVNGCMPVIIGGEHSITIGSLKALYDLYPDISILHFGARCNLKQISNENKYSSSCTLKRINELMPEIKMSFVGVRTISFEEAEWLETTNPNVEIYFARDKNKWNIADVLTNLTKNVYISFDFNVLDSGIMPCTSYPEPGGFTFEQTCEIIKNISAFKEIVGMDFVEFAPQGNLQAPEFLAAKLIYKSIGYSFARQLGAFEEESELAVK